MFFFYIFCLQGKSFSLNLEFDALQSELERQSQLNQDLLDRIKHLRVSRTTTSKLGIDMERVLKKYWTEISH